MKTINIKDKLCSTGKKSKKYNVIMYPDELEEFQSAIQDGREIDFVNDYILKNKAMNVVEKSDVYSLALIRAFKDNSNYMKKFLLEEERYFDALLVNSDISTNVLCAFLEKRDKLIYDEMVSYIKRHPQNTKFDSIDEYVKGNLAYAIQFPCSDCYTPASAIQELIRPIYTEEVVQSIIDIIGQDNINYYWTGFNQ